MELVLIHPDDTVQVNLETGHKVARRDIEKGEKVMKYGFSIGIATERIPAGEHVHSHNLRTALSGAMEYAYTPDYQPVAALTPVSIQAYVRENEEIGIRNDIWVIPTVGCVNGIAEQLAKEEGVIAFPHPYGCSQLGDDHLRTQKILCGLVRHPNAGGVLVVGLGCENNHIAEFKKVLGPYNEKRIRFLNCQDSVDELEEGRRIIAQLKQQASQDERVCVPISKLKIGLKCGGSDGLSGITANPLCGRITDRLTSMGAVTVLTEVPEMFGAEQLLMNRCVNREVFNKTVKLINNYKEYFLSHGQPVSENPSPGNKEGGITTLEEKSLGCVQKGGTAPVTAVLDYGDVATEPGLNLLNGPGNDIVAVTNLAAAGCHLILFTTGRGTPLGSPVPTIKIATNTALAEKKPGWIDFDAQGLGEEALLKLMIDTAGGEPTQNERCGFHDIAILKDGVTL